MIAEVFWNAMSGRQHAVAKEADIAGSNNPTSGRYAYLLLHFLTFFFIFTVIFTFFVKSSIKMSFKRQKSAKIAFNMQREWGLLGTRPLG